MGSDLRKFWIFCHLKPNVHLLVARLRVDPFGKWSHLESLDFITMVDSFSLLMMVDIFSLLMMVDSFSLLMMADINQTMESGTFSLSALELLLEGCETVGDPWMIPQNLRIQDLSASAASHLLVASVGGDEKNVSAKLDVVRVALAWKSV